MGAAEDAGQISGVRSRVHGGFAADAASDSGRHGPGGTAPSPYQVGPDTPGLLPEKIYTATLPSRRVPGWGVKQDQPMGSICAPPRAEHNFYTGGG